MWTDGSENDHTNFATDSGIFLNINQIITHLYNMLSGLEGGHCCIKTGAGGWRGGLCDTLLHGVCESRVTRVLAHPASLTVSSGHRLLAVRWDKSSDGWVPSRWLVRSVLSLYHMLISLNH